MNQDLPGGSFASVLGGFPAIQEAMQRRGQGAGVADQMSPAMPGANPMPETPPQNNPDIGALAATAGGAEKQPDSELNIALKALGGFVQSEGKLRRDLVSMRGQGMV